MPTDVGPTESDRAAAREIADAQDDFCPEGFTLPVMEIASKIATHHAEERERMRRLETPKPFSVGVYSAPDPAVVSENKKQEPVGERLRAELTEWLERNGIVSAIIELEHHAVRIDIDRLPPEIKNVLSCYGSIFIRNEEKFTKG